MNQNDNVKKITPEILEYYSNKSALLRIFKDGSVEKEQLLEDLYIEVYDIVADKPEYVVFEGSGKYGVKNGFLDVVIVPAIYDRIEFVGINNGLDTMFVVWSNGKAGIVKGDAWNTEILHLIYDNIEPFEAVIDYAKITVDNKCGIVRFYVGGAEIVIEPMFDNISLSYPFFLLDNQGKMGLYGNGYMLPAVYEDIFVPEDFGWVKVLRGKVWGYIDIKGEFTTDIESAYLYKNTI